MSPRILEQSRPRTSIQDYAPATIQAFLLEKLVAKGVVEAYLFGSFVRGTVNPWSDLDLVVIKATERPFVERPLEFDDLFELGIPVDILVYTPGEFGELRTSDSPFWRQFEKHHLRLI